MIGGGITFFQVISLILITVCIISLIVSISRDKNLRYATVPALIWLVHEYLFYVILLLDKSGLDLFPLIRFTQWSSLLRWHTSVTVFTIIMAKLLYTKTMKLR